MADKAQSDVSWRDRIPWPSPRTLLVIVLLLVGGVTSRRVWDSLHGELAQSPHYQLTADVIELEPAEPPPWIRTDVKAQVLRDSGITGTLSLLEDPGVIQRRLTDAFELHPWVRKVTRVDIASPRRIRLAIEYRQPVAVAEVTAGSTSELLPLDSRAVRLPEEDLTEVEKSYLPRIAHVEDRPLVGEAWEDIRMQGAAELAGLLASQWEPFSLLEIVPSDYPEVARSHRFYVYDIRASGGTLIHWGAAPSYGPPGESSFEAKLDRLAGYIDRHGALDSINSPKSIDVRDALHVEKRLAKQKAEEVLR